MGHIFQALLQLLGILEVLLPHIINSFALVGIGFALADCELGRVCHYEFAYWHEGFVRAVLDLLLPFVVNSVVLVRLLPVRDSVELGLALVVLGLTSLVKGAVYTFGRGVHHVTEVP